MASPFRVFRKYQKTLLVVAGVVLMFVFVIGDALMGYLGSARRGGGDSARDANAVAVRWNDDSLTNAELSDLVLQRRIVKSFVLGVWAAGERSAMEAGVEPRPLRVDPIFRPESAETPQAVVQTRLFADAAREAGMRVSDDTVVQYLDELGRGNVTRDDMRTMLSRLQSGSWQVSIDYVINALREELLARNYIASNQYAFDTVTPQQRWEDWLQVNDRVVIEAAAIPAERLVAEVKEPSEAELIAFFDQYKNREPQPDRIGQAEIPSPAPGFRIPRKVDVQFLQANYDKYLTKIEDEITDEEIEKYYEENKDPQFIKADTSLFEESSADDEVTDDATTEDATETPAAASESPEESSTNDVEPANTSEPSSDAESPASEETGSDEKATDDAPNDGDQSSHDAVRRSPFQLSAFLQESDSENPSEDDEKSDATAVDAEAPADESDDATKATSAPETIAVEPPAQSEADIKAAEEKPKEFQPLEEVRDLIRRELAQRRAAEQLNELVNELAGQLNAEFNTYFGQVLDAQAADREPPAPPAALADLAPLAKEHGLEHGQTGPMSVLDLRDIPVGKSGNSETGDSLLQSVFRARELELYQPVTTVDIDGNRFVAMKTSDTPGRVPEFSEVKEEVLRAWKKQQAGELALNEAKDDAKKAQEAGTSLADYFSAKPSVEVIRTDPFSQYTGGDVGFVGGQIQQQPFRLSEPDGISAAGPEFLRRVFDLKDGEVAAVLNHDHSIAYVIRIVEHASSPEELRTAYLSEVNTWPGLRLMIGSHAQVAAAALANDIIKTSGLEWEQQPTSQAEDDDEDAG